MAFQPIQVPKTEFEPRRGLDGILDRLKHELPGESETYYTEMRERILQTAMSNGYNIISVCDSFIVGAMNRGEGRNTNGL